jgi:hypothetical protein
MALGTTAGGKEKVARRAERVRNTLLPGVDI